MTDEPVSADNDERRFDRLLLDPTRLSIVATLSVYEWAEFGFVRDAAAVSDSALSKQAATLEHSRYIAVKKGYVGRRPRTWLRLTDQGRDALNDHVAALQDIVHRLTASRQEAPPQEQS